MRHRLVLSLEATSHSIAESAGNSSSYLGNLLSRNWATWRRALANLQGSGMSINEIRNACIRMNGCWMLDTVATADAMVRHLETLAWEYWHDNEELRKLLEESKPAPKSGKKTKG